MNINALKRITAVLATVLLSVTAINAQCFTTRRHKLIDADGKAFVIRGMNNPHAWFGQRAYDALDEIEAVGCNTVRIVWQTRGNDDELERIIRRCIELRMIPMVELHDVTGSPSKERLVAMAQWYSKPERAEMLKRYERYLLLNIANEWGDHQVSSDHWLDSYTEAVKTMRNAGYALTIVVDAPGWGQNITPFIEKGKDLINADPLHNILLSVHMYGSWNDPEKIRHDLKSCRKLKLPVIVGEFGYNSNDGRNNLNCKADHKMILATCNRLKYGYIPWSWTGNNAENQWLDLVDPIDWKTPTWWGREVIAGPGGITETSKKASVF
ncbi:MAG: cellulase family glycosylhydrolase [Bacteroidaceae bacterium]|nr:cellulase family glycosylhydrolase [Bacteroidaceae bacterium]